METLLALIMAVAPGIFWLLFFYSRDRYDPEPPVWIMLVFLLGGAVTFPVGILEGSLLALSGGFLGSVLIAPVFEELAKYWVVKKTVYGTHVFDEPVDGIVYAAAAGLGFATLENVLYILSALDQSFLLALQTAVVRAILSVPAHVLFSVMWGFALGVSQGGFPGRHDPIVFWGLCLAVGAHSLFNLLLVSGTGIPVLVLFLVPFLWVVTMNRIRDAIALSPFSRRW
jgi:RsiW-degrading membrane proteinase PrsW (M82 family)